MVYLGSGESNVVKTSRLKRDLRELTRSSNKAAISFSKLDLDGDQIETFAKEFIDLTMLNVKRIDLLEIYNSCKAFKN